MRRYNAARSPERIPVEKRLEEGQSIINNNSNDKAQTNYLQMSYLRRRKAILLFCCILSVILILVRTTTNFISSQKGADSKRYGPAINTTNPFISKFESTLLTDDLRLNNNFWVPLIYNTKDNKLLCREKHRNQLSRFRSRSYTQMIRTYLTSSNNNINLNIFNTTTETTTTIPILIMDADGNGCNIHHHRDDYGYPRLAWSELHNAKHGEYCNAISMPSYETWRYHHSKKKVSSDWESTFATNEYHYPWNNKINKAIWRGSTTYEGSQYGNAELKDTPRGKLVSMSGGLIDAGFTKINQKFSEQKNELKDQFNIAKRLHPSDMMKYKAIIDIDGNNWSSRFGTLLCSNSVVIKIEPDFIEYFYNTQNGGEVKPMMHYVPASLDNITKVVEYVMDTANENEMKSIVREANKWCAKRLSAKGLARDSMVQLHTYKKALDIYANMDDDWNEMFHRFSDTLDDLVDCKAWSIIDWFLFPMFMGL